MDRSILLSKTPWKVIIHSFKIAASRSEFLESRLAYTAGHAESFNPAVIRNQEADMIYGSIDSQKGHKGESS